MTASDGSADLTFACSVCGRPATTVRILQPGVEPPGWPGDAPPPDVHDWRLMVQTSGSGAWTTPIEPESDPLAPWRVGDFAKLRSLDSQSTGNYCFECQAWYCHADSPIRQVFEEAGATMYDWWWESVCPRGHKRTFERW
jgi:hypothetical protein